MDKIQKFLEKLTKKERQYIVNKIIPRIISLDLEGLDVKKLRNQPLWRVRWKGIRILFAKIDGKGRLYRVGFRKDVYKS